MSPCVLKGPCFSARQANALALVYAYSQLACCSFCLRQLRCGVILRSWSSYRSLPQCQTWDKSCDYKAALARFRTKPLGSSVFSLSLRSVTVEVDGTVSTTERQKGSRLSGSLGGFWEVCRGNLRSKHRLTT